MEEVRKLKLLGERILDWLLVARYFSRAFYELCILFVGVFGSELRFCPFVHLVPL
jgi:hypothetical protein